jgi:hypothetical protein
MTSWRTLGVVELPNVMFGTQFEPKVLGRTRGDIDVSVSTTDADGTERNDTTNVNSATGGLAWIAPPVTC